MTKPHTAAATEFIDHGSDTYTFLRDPVVDALLEVVVELGAETWITRRRMLVLERVMASQGLLSPDLIETYTPSPEDEALWRQERDRMLKSVYSALAKRPPSRHERGDAAAERAKGANPPRRAPLNAAELKTRGEALGPSGV
jgi:hypothetical protein